MRKEEKNEIIELLTEKLRNTNHIYLTDISGLTVEDTNKLRALCFKREIGLQTVKNTLLRKAMEKVEEKDFSGLYEALKGSTAVMFSENNNTPAKLIQEVRRKQAKPILKGAYVEESCYLGDNQIEALVAIKSKEELLGEVIGLLQSPAKNVISALLSGGTTIAGILKTLSEKE